MPLLLQYCGLNPRSAVILIACLASFFTGYRIIKDSIFVSVLEDVDNGSRAPEDFPESAVKTMVKLLITDLVLSGVLLLSSLLLLLGAMKSISGTMAWWTFIACLFICFDLGLSIYLTTAYYQLSDIAWSLAINCIWYAVGIYSICVVIFYANFIRRGNEYQSFGV